MVKVMDTIVKITNDLEPEGKDINFKIEKILANEIRRRLNRHELINRRFYEKYKVNFDEFKKTRMVERLGYSFEVENDFCDWEMALSGIECFKRDLMAIGELKSD